MKIIILTSSTDLRYGGGMDRVIHNARITLNKEFDLVLYVSAKNFIDLTKGIFKIIINNPFSFSFIIFNALSSVRSSSNPFWKYIFIFCQLFRIKPVFYWHEMPEYYANFSKNFSENTKSIERFFKGKNILQLCCSEANVLSANYFDKKPTIININNCIIPRKHNKNFLLSKFTVITVASIQDIKGTDIWTDVAIEVCRNNDVIQFIWCGGTVLKSMADSCTKKVEDAGFEDRISFLGKVEDAAVLTSASHLYFCSSRLDSFPLAILEAMNHGKNIIYYDSGGVVEAVAGEGVFIPNFSIELTVKAILQKYDEFIFNPDSVYNRNVQQRFYENYTPEIFVEKLKNALEKNNNESSKIN